MTYVSSITGLNGLSLTLKSIRYTKNSHRQKDQLFVDGID